MPDLATLKSLRALAVAPEGDCLQAAIERAALPPQRRREIEADAQTLVAHVRANESGLLESLMAEYGLSNDEGLALMCLAEAYLRVPDSATVDALLRDKLAGQAWATHLGRADSLLVNASTFGLLLSGQVLGSDDSGGGALRRLVRRAGEPMVRSAVGVAMRRMAEQFVLGREIDEAWQRAIGAGTEPGSGKGRYSFDMLGEAACTRDDAQRYFDAYRRAIEFLATKSDPSRDVFDNPGISVKLSALHPRYQASQAARLSRELVPRLRELACLAAKAGIGLNVDAEEANRLELSLSIIEQVLDDPALKGWAGFGVVVQAYAKTSLGVLDWCAAKARSLQRPLAVRLVKGAYWDSEIRHVQLLGLPSYPVYTRKVGTDVAYLAGARTLLDQGDLIYPQFATHNAHTVAAVLAMATPESRFEFQRLHGMGEVLHEKVSESARRRCRVYAPVGAHKDLLAYLVRRMLENGANASFVHQVQDPNIALSELAADPVDALLAQADQAGFANPQIAPAAQLFAPERLNSSGRDTENPADLDWIAHALEPWRDAQWQSHAIGPRLFDADAVNAELSDIFNPAIASQRVGSWQAAGPSVASAAVSVAKRGLARWAAMPGVQRAQRLEAIAEAYEQHTGELLALLIREAGKHRADAVAELREAVDFCRYYASLAKSLPAHTSRGVWVCISPWNFPLAIFTGQIVAALAAGNTVIAKPAEQTPLIAMRAIELMLGAGLAVDELLLLPGDGASVGAALVSESRIAGVSFTGSTETACHIDRAMAENGNPAAPLVAETGGLNAMIVDSTALPEAAVHDIIQSAFQSAGQRCSALRLLFVQRDIADQLIGMLSGAMDELVLGDPWSADTDIGPVIDAQARQAIEAHIAAQRRAGRVTHQVAMDHVPAGHFVAPTLIRLERAGDLTAEVFGPVLHWLTYEASELDQIVSSINATGFGLTFGLHTRIDRRAAEISRRMAVGNVYINRNQIGAVVGVQPFGGQGLSGTGPKAGGPFSLTRVSNPAPPLALPVAFVNTSEKRYRAVLPFLGGLSGGPEFDAALRRMRAAAIGHDDAFERFEILERAFALGPQSLAPRARHWLVKARALLLDPLSLNGATGETNTLHLAPRGLALCMGNRDADPNLLFDQLVRALVCGNAVLLSGPAAERVAAAVVPCLRASGLDAERVAVLDPSQLDSLVDGAVGPDVVLTDDDVGRLGTLRRRLAARSGMRIPLVLDGEHLACLCTERTVSVDTTASGGNVQLLALTS